MSERVSIQVIERRHNSCAYQETEDVGSVDKFVEHIKSYFGRQPDQGAQPSDKEKVLKVYTNAHVADNCGIAVIVANGGVIGVSHTTSIDYAEDSAWSDVASRLPVSGGPEDECSGCRLNIDHYCWSIRGEFKAGEFEHPRADCEGCNKPDCPCTGSPASAEGKVELPPLDVTQEERSQIENMRPMAPRNTLIALEHLACRERQLLVAQEEIRILKLSQPGTASLCVPKAAYLKIESELAAANLRAEQARRDALSEALKAVCNFCKDGDLYSEDAHEYKGKRYQCRAPGIRALLSDNALLPQKPVD